MLKKLKNDPLFPYLAGEKNKYLYILILTLLPAIIAGLMEGLSYVSLLLAVNVLKGDNSSSMAIFNIFIKLVKNLSQNKQFLIFIMLGLFIQILRSSFVFLSQYIVSRISIQITTKLQCKIYKQIFNFTYPFVSTYQAGSLINYNQAPLVIPSVLIQINNAFSSLALGFISLFWLIKIDFILTLVLLFFFFLINYIYKLILKKMSSLSVELSNDEVKFSSQSNQNINGIKLIHMFNRQNYIVDKTKEILHKIALSNSRITFWRTLINSFGEIIGIIVIAFMLVVGAFLLHHKNSFISYLLIFIFIAYRFSGRLQIFMNSFGEILAQKGAINRLKEILNEKDKEFVKEGGIELKNFTNKIEIKNLNFLYQTRIVPALENFTFTFEKGKTYAIIGKSGSGKSTLIDLILNLYKPTSGSINIDGINLYDIDLSSWRSKIGIVNQDIFLFHDTIIDNIKFGKEDTTFENIINSCKLANAHQFISNLPDQYNTIVGEKGHKLSGGERQRIALARALIKNPDILILDEATSHLDSHSEKLIQESIENLRQEKTILIIAHRLSTVINADQIIVMHDGKLIEKGNHSELINKQGHYAYFWRIQSKSKEQNNKDSYENLELNLEI